MKIIKAVLLVIKIWLKIIWVYIYKNIYIYRENRTGLAGIEGGRCFDWRQIYVLVILLLLSSVACRVVSGSGLFSVSGRKRQKNELSRQRKENIMKGVLKLPIVDSITLSWGAHTPPTRAIATLMPTPVLRMGVG